MVVGWRSRRLATTRLVGARQQRPGYPQTLLRPAPAPVRHRSRPARRRRSCCGGRSSGSPSCRLRSTMTASATLGTVSPLKWGAPGTHRDQRRGRLVGPLHDSLHLLRGLRPDHKPGFEWQHEAVVLRVAVQTGRIVADVILSDDPDQLFFFPNLRPWSASQFQSKRSDRDSLPGFQGRRLYFVPLTERGCSYDRMAC